MLIPVGRNIKYIGGQMRLKTTENIEDEINHEKDEVSMMILLCVA